MKHWYYSFLVLFIALTSCTSIKTYNEKISQLHSVNNLQEDVDAIYTQLQKHHPRLYQYTSKKVLDFQIDSLKTSITSPMTSQRFYEKLTPVIKQVRQGHVSSVPPHKRFTKKERKALGKTKFEFNDLDFEYLDNKLWVENSKTDSLLVGSEVVKMEQEEIDFLIKKYQSQIASDGYNTTLYNRFVGLRFTGLYYRDKGFLDSLSVTFKKQDSIFTKVFRRVDKDKKNNDQDSIKKPSDSLKVVKLTKEQKKARKLAAKEKRIRDKEFGFEPSRKRYTRNLNFMDADSTTAVMKIRGFSNGNYKNFYRNSFALLQNAKTKYLVLDLRDNGGGRISEIAYLYSYLTSETYQFINPSEVTSRTPIMTFAMSNTTPLIMKITAALLSPFIVTHNLLKTKKVNDTLYYNFKYAKPQEPQSNYFNGKIYVVINGNSFSASSILSTQLKANNLATFVGEETGGAYNGTVAGLYKVYELPNSLIRVRMGLMQVDAPFKITPDGYGIKPDVYIVPTQDDRLNQIDPELEWIFNDIKQLEHD